jgi:hypothetical protein
MERNVLSADPLSKSRRKNGGIMNKYKYTLTLESEEYGVSTYHYDTRKQAEEGFKKLKNGCLSCIEKDQIPRKLSLTSTIKSIIIKTEERQITMGDRAYLGMTCRKEDEGKITERLGEAEEVFEVYGPDKTTVLEHLLDLRWQEVNYAGEDYRDELAVDGIPFYGWHDQGDTYGPGVFASIDGAQVCVESSTDGIPIAEISEELKPSEEDMKKIAAYYEKVRAVQVLFGEREA